MSLKILKAKCYRARNREEGKQGGREERRLTKKAVSQAQQLTPVILTTWETDEEDHSSRPVPAKKFMRPHLNEIAGHGGMCLSSH
jgi:hypothetical protein